MFSMVVPRSCSNGSPELKVRGDDSGGSPAVQAWRKTYFCCNLEGKTYQTLEERVAVLAKVWTAVFKKLLQVGKILEAVAGGVEWAGESVWRRLWA